MNIISEGYVMKRKKSQKKIKKFNYGLSDTICQIIIDKIITNSIVQSRSNYVNSKINNHCFGFVTNCIDTFLSIDFIFHENNHNKYCNNISIKENTSSIANNINNELIIIEEPITPEIDRHHTIKTKIVKDPNIITKDQNFFFQNNLKRFSSKNFNEKETTNTFKTINTRSHKKLMTLKEALELEYQNNNDKISNRKLTIFGKERNFNMSKKESKKYTIKYNISNINNSNNIDNINNDIERENEKKTTKNLVIELPCCDLPKELYENKYVIMNDSHENNLLRLEKEKENFNKEQQKNLEKKQKKKEFEKRIKIKFTKEFDTNKITFDSNGNIINVNIPNVDSFSKDFYISEPIINDIKIKPFSLYRKNKESNKKLNQITKTYEQKEQKDIIKDLNKLDSKETNNNNNNNSINNNIQTEYGKKKEKEKKQKKINKISKIKFLSPSYSSKSIINEIINTKIKVEYNPSSEEKKEKSPPRFKLPPSGPNFDKMIPEVGVVIQNDDKDGNEIKQGGFEYYNKYNKPSINEYTQLVKETLKINNKLKYSSLTIGDANLNHNKKVINKNFPTEQSDYNGYNQVFIDNNNPLIQNALESFSSIKSKMDYDNIVNNKSLIKSRSQIEVKHNNYKGYYKSYDNNNHKIRNTKNKFFNTIKMSEQNYVSNLYNILSNNDDTNSKFNKNMFKVLKKRSFSNLSDEPKDIINNNIFSLSPSKRIYSSSNKESVLPYINKKNNYKNNNIELLGEDFINNFNTKIIKSKNWGDDFSAKNEKNEYEKKNIFRKPIGLHKYDKHNGIIGTRKRIPYIINTNINEKKKLLFNI